MIDSRAITRVSRQTGLLEAEVDGELVGLHIDNGTAYGFNGPATRIWALIEEPQTLDEICAVLTAEYEVDAQTCAADVTDVLEELEREGLVELVREG